MLASRGTGARPRSRPRTGRTHTTRRLLQGIDFQKQALRSHRGIFSSGQHVVMITCVESPRARSSKRDNASTTLQPTISPPIHPHLQGPRRYNDPRGRGGGVGPQGRGDLCPSSLSRSHSLKCNGDDDFPACGNGLSSVSSPRPGGPPSRLNKKAFWGVEVLFL